MISEQENHALIQLLEGSSIPDDDVSTLLCKKGHLNQGALTEQGKEFAELCMHALVEPDRVRKASQEYYSREDRLKSDLSLAKHQLHNAREKLRASQRLLESEATRLVGEPAVASVLVENVIIDFSEEQSSLGKEIGPFLAFGESGVNIPAQQRTSFLGWTLDQEDADLAVSLKHGRYSVAIVVFKDGESIKPVLNEEDGFNCRFDVRTGKCNTKYCVRKDGELCSLPTRPPSLKESDSCIHYPTPCIFCKAKGVRVEKELIDHIDNSKLYVYNVFCEECNAVGPIEYSEEDAISSWSNANVKG